MPRRVSISIELPESQKQLLGRLHEGTSNAKSAIRLMMRAEVVTRAADGQTNYMIAKQLGISRNTVKLWRYRFAREGLVGLKSRPIPGRPRKASDSDGRNLSPITVEPPRDGTADIANGVDGASRNKDLLAGLRPEEPALQLKLDIALGD